MSLLGSLNAAVGGMNAQSASIGNISDNIANSQTVGFKQADTAFVDYLTDSSASTHAPGAVVARPEYTNTVQGAVTQVSNPTSLAVSGQGFFSVQRPISGTTLSDMTYYTRVGDFAPNSNGQLVNTTGYVLDGWKSNNVAGSSFDQSRLSPITISKAPSLPVPTATINLAANLPSTPPAGTTSYSTAVQVYDAGGNARNVNLQWDQVPTTAPGPVSSSNPAVPNQWALTIQAGSTTTGPLNVQFGTGSQSGMITGITAAPTDPAGTVPASQASGAAATVALTPDFGLGAQAISLNLGQFGTSSGITQFAANNYQVASTAQDGSPQGNFSSVAIQANGNVVINYDNGATATVAKVPLTNFNSADALQQQDGQAFTATLDSGSPNTFAAGTGGTGKLIVGAEEASNVDIAAQFTQMIVAQRAYTANTKVISTTNQLLQDTLNMVQG